MNFRSEIGPVNYKGLIKHGLPIVMLGSCFTDEIGAKLQADGFKIHSNIFGPIYSVDALLNVLNWVFSNEDVPIFQHDGLWRSFLAHTKISSSDCEELKALMLQKKNLLLNAIKSAQTVIITLGSARAFYVDGTPVTNCHKLPSNVFVERMSSPVEISECLNSIYSLIKRVNTFCKFIITISPIRHGGHGAHGNQLNKAVLLLGLEDFINGHTDVIYFPAYEYLLDDLRDYRFYADDLKHPSQFAVKYIYEKFSESFFDRSTTQISKEFNSLFLRNKHRNILSPAQQIEDIKQDFEILCEKYPEFGSFDFDSLNS